MVIQEWRHGEPSIFRTDVVPRKPFSLQPSHPISPCHPSLLASPWGLSSIPTPLSHAKMPRSPQQSPSCQCRMCPAPRIILCSKITAPGTLWDKRHSMLPVTWKSWTGNQHTFCYTKYLCLSQGYQKYSSSFLYHNKWYFKWGHWNYTNSRAQNSNVKFHPKALKETSLPFSNIVL